MLFGETVIVYVCGAEYVDKRRGIYGRRVEGEM
jgi:hypothetical protein